MKKIITLMLLVAFAGIVNVKAGTETTVYYAVPADVVGSYTVKLNVQLATNNGDSWQTIVMTKTEKTYFGKHIYTCNYTDWHDGVATMQFQLYNGDSHVSEQQPISSWEGVNNFNGKMYEHDTGWRAYNYDKTVTIHAKKTSSWTPTNVHDYFNDGATGNVSETNWPGKATTQSTLNTEWYDYVITGRPCTTVIVNNGNNGNGNQSGDVTIGDEGEYWVTYDGSNTTSASTAPSDYNYTRSVTSGKYGTICLPYAATVTGATVFKIVGKYESGGNLAGINLDSVDNLEAGKAYIFKATGNTLTATLSGSATSASTNWCMTGNLAPTAIDVPTGGYIIKNNQIRKVVDGGAATVGQYKAFITSDIESMSSGVRGAVYIGFVDDTTGIDEMESTRNVEDETFYNLAGQRVTQPTKGLYIVNGKKVLRK